MVKTIKFAEKEKKFLFFISASLFVFWGLGDILLPENSYRYFFLVLSLIGAYGFSKERVIATGFRISHVMISFFAAFQICGYQLFFVLDITWWFYVLFGIMVVYAYFVLRGILAILCHMQQVCINAVYMEPKECRKIQWIVFLLIAAAEVFMLLAYWPGIYSFDSWTCYDQALNILEQRSDIHSFLYVCIIALCTKVSLNCALLVISMVLIFAGVFSSFMSYLYKYGVKKKYIIGVTVIFCIMPNNMYMLISVWKDVPFTIGLLSLTFALTKWAFEGDKVTCDRKWQIHTIVSLIAVACFRSNGMAVLFGLFLIIAIRAIREKKVKKEITIMMIAVAIVLLVKFPIFSFLNVSGTPEGFASLPFVDAVWANAEAGIELPDEIREAMKELIPYDDWENLYEPGHVNNSIWDSDGFEKPPLKEAVCWYNWCLIHSPKITVQARLIKTGFIWNYFCSGQEDFSYNCDFGEMQNERVLYELGAEEWQWQHLEETYFLREWFQKYINFFDDKFQFLYRGGFHLTLWLLLMVEYIAKKSPKNALVIVPIVINTAALFVGTCYSDYRYIWGMELLTWFFVLIYTAIPKKVKAEMAE